MKISQNKFLNHFYLFVSRRRWLRRMHFIKLPDIGFYQTAQGFRYAVSLNDWRGPSYHLINWGEETYEAENKKFLLAFLPEKKGVFLDIGANIGLFSFYFKKNKPDIQAYLFEPEPIANACLKKTIEWNSIEKIEVSSIALSNKLSSATFFIDGKNFGGHSLVETNITSEGDNIADKITVKTTSLDLFAKEQKLNAIHAIKIDVQGHEFEVISGGLGVLKEYKPVLLVECYFRELCSENSILNVFKQINDGKDFFIFEPRSKKTFSIQELSEHAVIRKKQDDLAYSDFLFIPDNQGNRHTVSILSQ